jgi:hypothetical protein
MIFVNGKGSLFLMLNTLPFIDPVCANTPKEKLRKKTIRANFKCFVLIMFNVFLYILDNT